MKKLEQIQKSKLISSYGASGSVIMTKDNGSLLVKEYDRWPAYGGRNPHFIEITDNRLLDFIQTKFPHYAHVQNLVAMPNEDLSDFVYTANANNCRNTISSGFFPKWYYCPHCRRLHKLNDWGQMWEDNFAGDDSFYSNPAACPMCSTQNGSRFHRRFLEQVRFVLASFDGGDLQEVPFDKLIVSDPNGNVWNTNNINGATDELYYRTSAGGDGLQSVFIQLGEHGARLQMSALMRKYILIGHHAYTLLLRNNNSLYYPNILRCLYIPPRTNTVRDKIIKLINKGLSVEDIFDFLHPDEPDLRLEDVQFVHDYPNEDFTPGDLDFDEFKYIIDPRNYTHLNSNKESKFWSVRYPQLRAEFIKCFYGLKQLKETSVLLSYSRVSSERREWYNPHTGNVEEMEPARKLPFQNTNNISYLPAVESYGEGIMFELDLDRIPLENRYVFAHTYCHMIMKEMEFKCGYPVASLKEKIYYSENDPDRIGFLIYTIAGSEGSFGGLLALLPWNHNGTNAAIQDLIRTALQRVQHCNNDPICIHENGHCFACLDLPETTCCKWNQDLDRRVVIENLHLLDNEVNLEDDIENEILDE